MAFKHYLSFLGLPHVTVHCSRELRLASALFPVKRTNYRVTVIPQGLDFIL